MDYSSCIKMFTKEQAARMRCAAADRSAFFLAVVAVLPSYQALVSISRLGTFALEAPNSFMPRSIPARVIHGLLGGHPYQASPSPPCLAAHTLQLLRTPLLPIAGQLHLTCSWLPRCPLVKTAVQAVFIPINFGQAYLKHPYWMCLENADMKIIFS